MNTCRELNNCIYEDEPDFNTCLECEYGIVLCDGEWVDEIEKDPSDFDSNTQEYDY